MGMTDPIANMLTKMRNAIRTRKPTVEVSSSKMNVRIAQILLEEGYINAYDVIPDNKQGMIKITLKYDERSEGVITNLQRVSKPGRRVYVGKEEIPTVLGGLGIAIIRPLVQLPITTWSSFMSPT